MGIVVFAAPVSGIRGKVGGIVYSANKSGPYIKQWGKGSNPRTADQTEHRADLVQFSQRWDSLTTAEKDDWDTYAALPAQDKTNSLGETYSASGFAWYIEINLNLKAGGAAIIDTAPTGGTPGTPILNLVRLFATAGGTASNITLDGASPGLTGLQAIKGVLVNSEGRTAQAEIRPVMAVTLRFGATNNFRFQTGLEARFGTVQLNQRIFVTTQFQNAEGRRSATASGFADAQA